MVYRLNHKKIIFILLFFLIITGIFIWYKEETTDKEIPKKAYFVYKN